jgi:NAD(P) transhydrogenase subunit alpha
MQLSVIKETREFEKRVALVPDTASKLQNAGIDIVLQSGAGEQSGFSDQSYIQKGVKIADSFESALNGADLIAKVLPFTENELNSVPKSTTQISLLAPGSYLEIIKLMQVKSMTAFSFELLPRISRAQSMDALSSQATVSGYVATLTCAINLPLFFPMFMTAAGTVPPAKVFVMGAGVAGLQAIATARRLGANVRAYDVRPAAAEEVKSLGATFVTLDLESQEGAGGYAKEQSAEFIQKQQELMAEQVAQCNVIITTAAIPGRPAPKLLTQKMVEGMAKGSVVFDLAAESGGNCELSKPGEIIEHDGVKIIGARNVPSQLPTHASFLYSRNVAELVLLMTKDGNFEPNFEDEIVNGSCVLKNGEIFNEMTKKLIEDSK